MRPQDLSLRCRDCSLAELCLPRGLDEEELRALENMVVQRRPLRTGEILYRSGALFDSLYAVKSGSVKSVISTTDGEEQVVGFHMPGELFGLDGLGPGGYACTTSALERTTVCELPFSHVERLSRAHAGLSRELCSLMGREINEHQSRLLLLARRSAEERLATFLLSLSRRLHARGYSQLEFSLSMSRHDIANYLGLAPETVSRLFTRFGADGVLEVDRRHLRICSLDRLRSLVDALPA